MPGKSEEWSRQEIRTVIHFLNSGGFSNEEICIRIWEVCGRDSVSRKEVCHICAGDKHDEEPALVNKKKKTKEKDLNKRGESKEGGDTDAFLSKTEGFSYAAATSPSVGGSYTHDMNKQVQTAPAGLYSSSPSGSMTGAGPQHHQPGVRRPVPIPQSTSVVPTQVQKLRARPRPLICPRPLIRPRMGPIPCWPSNFTAPHQFSMPSSPVPMYHLPLNNKNSCNQTTLFFGQMSREPSTFSRVPAPIQRQVGPKKTAVYKGLPIIDPATGRDVREDITNEPFSQGSKGGSQSNNWVPCRAKNDLKTIDQIHKEDEREANEQQQMLQQMTFPKKMPDDPYMRKNRPLTSEDGWNMSGKSSKGNYTVEPLKLKPTKSPCSLVMEANSQVEPKVVVVEPNHHLAWNKILD